jgi:hypothetical protein
LIQLLTVNKEEEKKLSHLEKRLMRTRSVPVVGG